MKSKQKSANPQNPRSNAFAEPVSSNPTKKFPEKYWLYGALIAAVLVFANILQHGFVNFDDDTGILANPLYHQLSIDNLIAIFKTPNLGMYAPITGLLYTVLYTLGNGDPLLFHAASLILHMINIVLVYKILKLIFPENAMVFGLSTLLFAVHPIQSESVAWAASMSTPLYALFYFSAILTYLNFAATQQQKQYWFTLILFVLALLSKSAAVTLPVVLLAIDYYQQKSIGVKHFVAKVPFFILSFIFGALTFMTRADEGHSISLSKSEFNFFDRILMVPQTIFFYFGKLLAPVNLCISYPFAKVDGAWSVSYYLAPLLLLGLGYYAYTLYKAEQKEKLFGLLLYFAAIAVMLPVITIGNFELRSDRYNYVAMIGFCIFCIALLQQVLGNSQQAKVVGIVVAALFALTTFNRNKVWADSVQLFTDVIKKTEKQAFAYYNRGLAHYQNQSFPAAIADFNNTLSLDPDFNEVYARRGFSYFKLNDSKALPDFEKADQLEPNNPDILINYAKACLLVGNLRKGIEVSNKAIKLNEKNPELYFVRAMLLSAGKVQDKAIEDYSMAIALNTKYADAYVNRGNIYAVAQQYDNALSDFNAALAANPNHVRALNNRGNLRTIQGDNNGAIEDFTKAIAADPKYANAYVGRAKAYEKVGNLNAMQQDIQSAKNLGIGK